MKTTYRSFALLTGILLGGSIAMGCASTGIQRSTQAATTMQTMDNHIKLIVVQLDATGASLGELTKPGQSDVKKAFELFTGNLSEIEKLERDFAKNSEKMEARGTKYFEEWEGAQYKNPQIQQLSDQRHLELEEIYGRIAQNSLGAKDRFKAYVAEAKEIQAYLSNDLTSKGIQSIAPIAAKTVSDGKNLTYAMKNIQTAIEEARAEMSQTGATPYR